jgi:hypothetical protein
MDIGRKSVKILARELVREYACWLDAANRQRVAADIEALLSAVRARDAERVKRTAKSKPTIEVWYCNGCGNTFPHKRRRCRSCKCGDIRMREELAKRPAKR